MTIDPKEVSIPTLHKYLLGSVGPRPIGFASTVDKEGNRNLAPFSFFNVFSANPPILIFSPARSGRTNTTKDTYNNVKEVPEVVINVVNFDIVHQMSLASTAYESNVDEFVKAGLTPLDSDLIKPSRVKESPVQFECKVLEVNELGANGGAGNLVVCEVVKMHINDNVLGEDGMIDQHKIDLVARMGGNWYCRANSDSMFEINKPITSKGVGFDKLPSKIRDCANLSGNEVAILAGMETLLGVKEIDNELESIDSVKITLDGAKELLALNKLTSAYAVLMKIL